MKPNETKQKRNGDGHEMETELETETKRKWKRNGNMNGNKTNTEIAYSTSVSTSVRSLMLAPSTSKVRSAERDKPKQAVHTLSNNALYS